jgi:hypothetical protein
MDTIKGGACPGRSRGEGEGSGDSGGKQAREGNHGKAPDVLIGFCFYR